MGGARRGRGQLIGLVVIGVLTLGCGLLAGALIKLTGTTRLAYEDREEFTGFE
jgi:ammonium transporter Rh